MPPRTRRARLQEQQQQPSQDGPQAAAAGAPAFASLPVEIHHAIGGYLWYEECLAVSGLAKALVAPFGGQFTWLRVGTGGRELSALRAFIRRQERLERLSIWESSCFFTVIEALAGRGVGGRLRGLYLNCASTGALTTLSAEDGRGIAALMSNSPAFLPALEKLEISFKGPSRLQLEILLGAVARGAAPNLRTLALEYPEEMDEGLVGALVDLLAEALEARRRVEGCVPLSKVDFYRGDYSPLVTTYPRKLLAAVLPTIERIEDGDYEYYDNDDDDDEPLSFIHTLLEFGAPNLQKLYVKHARLARGLASFPRLEKLRFGDADVEMLEAVQEAAAAAGGWHAFLPSLREIGLSFSLYEEDENALVEVMGRTPWFPAVQKLRFHHSDCPVRSGRAVAAAFAAGAFASLSELSMHGFKGGDVGDVLSALAASDCARCLKSLNLTWCATEDVSELASLGAAIGANRFPTLRYLAFSFGAPDGAIKALVEALTPAHAPPLEAFQLLPNTLQDADVIAVAAALRDGSLGSGLKQLGIGYYESDITQVGATALADALAAADGEHVQRLEELRFIAPSLSADETREFVERALAACPRLTLVKLRGANLSAADKDALAAVMKEKRGNKAMCSTI